MERIVIVDEHDNDLGEEEKEKCHDGEGILHRAFLTMVFNNSGELLLARRSDTKRLWPGFWDGTIASHVRKGEDYEQASKRRLVEEIGLSANTVKYLFKFHYKVGYRNLGTEHEICAVTVVQGVEERDIAPDDNEISDIKPIALESLMDERAEDRLECAPWLLLAVEHMSNRRLLNNLPGSIAGLIRA